MFGMPRKRSDERAPAHDSPPSPSSSSSSRSSHRSVQSEHQRQQLGQEAVLSRSASPVPPPPSRTSSTARSVTRSLPVLPDRVLELIASFATGSAADDKEKHKLGLACTRVGTPGFVALGRHVLYGTMLVWARWPAEHGGEFDVPAGRVLARFDAPARYVKALVVRLNSLVSQSMYPPACERLLANIFNRTRSVRNLTFFPDYANFAAEAIETYGVVGNRHAVTSLTIVETPVCVFMPVKARLLPVHLQPFSNLSVVRLETNSRLSPLLAPGLRAPRPHVIPPLTVVHVAVRSCAALSDMLHAAAHTVEYLYLELRGAPDGVQDPAGLLSIWYDATRAFSLSEMLPAKPRRRLERLRWLHLHYEHASQAMLNLDPEAHAARADVLPAPNGEEPHAILSSAALGHLIAQCPRLSLLELHLPDEIQCEPAPFLARVPASLECLRWRGAVDSLVVRSLTRLVSDRTRAQSLKELALSQYHCHRRRGRAAAETPVDGEPERPAPHQLELAKLVRELEGACAAREIRFARAFAR